ncbi:MAG: hypothetical protein KC910_18550 [Candidatus Eremiobacteraeota bacterium]|nr:hypothetical protein [Candidatus Eremiobacteraeota bacterium]
MSDPARQIALVGTVLTLAVALPGDLRAIAEGFSSQGEWQLSLGLSLKLMMHLLAIVGLYLDQTFGYAFLLGASLQGGLIATGYLVALDPTARAEHPGQLVWPALDLGFRGYCLAFLAVRWRRIIGKEE